MRILAVLTDPFTVPGILRHLGLPHTAPPLTPARAPPRGDPAPGADPFLDLDQTPAFDPTEPDPIPDWPPMTAHSPSTPAATSAPLRFDFDQTWRG